MIQSEEPDEPPTLTSAKAPPSDDVSFGSIFSANRDAAEYDAVAWGRNNAMVDATANRIDAIKQATGEDVPNPYNGGYFDEAMAAHAQEDPLFRSTPFDNAKRIIPSPYRPLTADDLPRLDELQMQAFQNQLTALKRKYPDKADVIGADRPISADAIELANATSKRAGALSSATSGLLPWSAAFLGSMVGSFRDPIQAAALFVPGGPEVEAASVAGKIAVAGVRQAVINAGVSAVSQPAVQQWRAQRGQESGFLPALQDVGMNALFGAIPGAGIEGAKIAGTAAWSSISRNLAERAVAGDPAAARSVVGALPKDSIPAAHEAIQAVRLDQLAQSEPLPPGVTPLAVEQPYRQAVRNAEDPAEPLPQLAFPSTPGTNDAIAIEAVQGARTPLQAIDAIRNNPKTVEGALASPDPALERAGHVASLGDEAYAMVRSGEANPAVAAEVASRVTSPADQLAILREVTAQKPASAYEAAQLVSHAMERRATPTAQHVALAADGAPSGALSAPEVDRGEIAGRSAQLDQLEKELAPHVQVELHAQNAVEDRSPAAEGEAQVGPVFSEDLTQHAERLMKMGGHQDMARAMEEAAIKRVPEDIRNAVDASATPEGRGHAAAEGAGSAGGSGSEAELSRSGERFRRPSEVGGPDARAADRAGTSEPRPSAEPGAAAVQPAPEAGDVRPYLDTVPSSSRMDGRDMTPMNRADLITREPREGFLASIIVGCPGA